MAGQQHSRSWRLVTVMLLHSSLCLGGPCCSLRWSGETRNSQLQLVLLFHSRSKYVFAHSWWLTSVLSQSKPQLRDAPLRQSEAVHVRPQQLLDVRPQQPRDGRPQQPRDVRPLWLPDVHYRRSYNPREALKRVVSAVDSRSRIRVFTVSRGLTARQTTTCFQQDGHTTRAHENLHSLTSAPRRKVGFQIFHSERRPDGRRSSDETARRPRDTGRDP